MRRSRDPQSPLCSSCVPHEVYYELSREEMLPFIPLSARRILEVGCGGGVFGHQVKENRNAEVWGVEPNPKAAALAAKRLDHVIVGEFSPGTDLQGQLFDCIVFNDVLEHMVDPWSTLSFARKHLTETGAVVASMPNLKLFRIMWDLLIHDRWRYTPSGVLDITHLRFFTKTEMICLFEGAGYQVDLIQGINPEPQGRKFKVLNGLFPSRVSDMRYLQFAVVARPCREEGVLNG